MYFSKNKNEISNIIKNGGVALMQVDTVFGLICDGTKNSAIQKIEKIKKRNKPSFGFFVKNLDIAKKYAIFNKIQEECFNKIFPGYFTLILKANKNAEEEIPNRALGEKNFYINNTLTTIKTIGLRMPKDNFCLNVLDDFNIPLVATSANISKKKTPTTFEEIDKEIINSVDVIYYDNSKKIAGINSTIIDITDINNCLIIREGSGNLNLLKTLHFVKY